MKAKVLIAGTITAVLTAGLLAQDAAQSAQSKPTPAANKVTVVGCIERAAPSATGTSGSAAGTVNATAFMLTNTTQGSASSSGTSSSSGANAPAPGGTNKPATVAPSSGASAQAKMTGSYRLDADESKLTPHVGHKVEITGTVDASGTAASSSSTSPTGASASAQVSAPRLKVDEIKMIASSCTE